MNALRIYAHGGRRPLGGPPRPTRSPLLANASSSFAPVAAPPPSCEPVAPERVAAMPSIAGAVPARVTDEPDTLADGPEPTTPTPPPPPARTSVADAPMLAILSAAPQFGETVSAAYARKERELRDVLAALTPADALALHQRLVDPRTDDVVATAFTRLVAQRRARLLHFLADAPRRDAIACARR